MVSFGEDTMDVRMPDGTIITNVPKDIKRDELLKLYEGNKKEGSVFSRLKDTFLSMINQSDCPTDKKSNLFGCLEDYKTKSMNIKNVGFVSFPEGMSKKEVDFVIEKILLPNRLTNLPKIITVPSNENIPLFRTCGSVGFGPCINFNNDE